MADWDSMGCVITQTRGQAYQTLSVLKAWLSVSKARLSLSEARPHVLKQKLGRVFRSMETGVFDNPVNLNTSNTELFTKLQISALNFEIFYSV